jgi:hypothetical protein
MTDIIIFIKIIKTMGNVYGTGLSLKQINSHLESFFAMPLVEPTQSLANMNENDSNPHSRLSP